MSKSLSKTKRFTRGSQPARANISAGRYRKGHKKFGGRKKGVQNVLSGELKEAIIIAAVRLGADGNGKDGLEGYLMMLARDEPKTFGMLLRAVLPLQVTASIETSLNVRYKTLEEAREEARKLGLPERRIFELKDYRRIDDGRDGSAPEA
jgi:hypothetical protein